MRQWAYVYQPSFSTGVFSPWHSSNKFGSAHWLIENVLKIKLNLLQRRSSFQNECINILRVKTNV